MLYDYLVQTKLDIICLHGVSPLSTSHRFYGHLWLICGNHPLFLFCLSKMITEVRSSIPLTLSNEIYIGHVRLEWMMRGKRNTVALISIKEDRKPSQYSLFQHGIHFNSNYPILFIMLLFGLLTVLVFAHSRKNIIAFVKFWWHVRMSFNSAIGQKWDVCMPHNNYNMLTSSFGELQLSLWK